VDPGHQRGPAGLDHWCRWAPRRASERVSSRLLAPRRSGTFKSARSRALGTWRWASWVHRPGGVSGSRLAAPSSLSAVFMPEDGSGVLRVRIQSAGEVRATVGPLGEVARARQGIMSPRGHAAPCERSRAGSQGKEDMRGGCAGVTGVRGERAGLGRSGPTAGRWAGGCLVARLGRGGASRRGSASPRRPLRDCEPGVAHGRVLIFPLLAAPPLAYCELGRTRSWAPICSRKTCTYRQGGCPRPSRVRVGRPVAICKELPFGQVGWSALARGRRSACDANRLRMAFRGARLRVRGRGRAHRTSERREVA